MSLDISFDLKCNVCGQNLDASIYYPTASIDVEPCSDCLEAEYDTGYKAGLDDDS